jgi:hypothetical protein
MLETRRDVVPGPQDAFLVLDVQLLVQAMSRRAEQLLACAEDLAVHRPVSELLQPADAEAGTASSFAGAVADAVGGGDDPGSATVRPWNTFGVRLRARVAPCGPPRAALVVLETAPTPTLRAV